MKVRKQKTAASNRVAELQYGDERFVAFPRSIQGRCQTLFDEHGFRLMELFTDKRHTRHSLLVVDDDEQLFWIVFRGDKAKVQPVKLIESVRIYGNEKGSADEGTHEPPTLRWWYDKISARLRRLERLEWLLRVGRLVPVEKGGAR